MKPTKMILTTLAALAALAVVAGASVATYAQDQGGAPAPTQNGQEGKGRHARHERRGMRHGGFGGERLQERAKSFRARRHEMKDVLAITPEQRRLFVEKARVAQPILEQARKDLAAALVGVRDARGAAKSATTATPAEKPKDEAARAAAKAAKKAEREALMAPVKAARTKALEALSPLARDVVASLTAEQRARLEGFAAARGRKLDEKRLERFVIGMFRKPMALAMAEAELNRTK